MKHKIREFLYKRYSISFSKSGDDIQLLKLINSSTPGTYVDVGCWHPVKASNTYYFYLRNWKGICIDPNPEIIDLYRKIRPNDTFINCGIGQFEEKLKYYMLDSHSDSMNTFDYEFISNHKLDNCIKKVIEVPIVPLKKILDEKLLQNDRLDFFDIDVEGHDLEVLKSNNWFAYRPKIVVIESDLSIQEDLNSEITIFLKNVNYRIIGKSIINGNLGNLFFINND